MEHEIVKRLFLQYYAKMQRVARALLYDEQESEDVVSDIFETLLQGNVELLPETEEHYLLVSVRNQCLKRLRHEAIVRDLQVEPSLDQPQGDDDRLTDIIEYVVGHLTEQQQRIFRLRFTEGYSYEEIAQQVGISRVAVWKHLSHSIAAIKNHFNTPKL